MIVKLIDFVDKHDELLGQKIVSQLVTFLYGTLSAPKKECICCIDFGKLLRVLGYNGDNRYWLEWFVEQYDNHEEIAYRKLIEEIKSFSYKLEDNENHFRGQVEFIDSLYSTHIANAMAVLKNYSPLAMDYKSVVYLRTWLCGYITANLVSHQKCDEIDWEYIMSAIKSIMRQFDQICENNKDISWELFFYKYNVCLNAYGLDLENIIQEKREKRFDEGFYLG
ncbi:MAG: hypothetical protein K2K70_10425 [Lachnospiraceae bacterium]|nr:hypothetical protein [Lachnospiraceae bacterium]